MDRVGIPKVRQPPVPDPRCGIRALAKVRKGLSQLRSIDRPSQSVLQSRPSPPLPAPFPTLTTASIAASVAAGLPLGVLPLQPKHLTRQSPSTVPRMINLFHQLRSQRLGLPHH